MQLVYLIANLLLRVEDEVLALERLYRYFDLPCFRCRLLMIRLLVCLGLCGQVEAIFLQIVRTCFLALVFKSVVDTLNPRLETATLDLLLLRVHGVLWREKQIYGVPIMAICLAIHIEKGLLGM